MFGMKIIPIRGTKKWMCYGWRSGSRCFEPGGKFGHPVIHRVWEAS
jgi:hypothetical protein